MKESKFQKILIDEIEKTIPSAIVLKNDASYLQGFPDLIVLVEDGFVCLETKTSAKASIRPNQEYWVRTINEQGGYARFIYPENKKEILDEVYRVLTSKG